MELRAAIEQHKQRILQLKKERDEASVLQQDVESAQRAYDAINQRFTQINLESQTTQTNIYLLTPATEALNPSSPRVVLNTAISAFLGLMLGVGIALLLELMDQRIRSEEELLGLLEVPVLGAITTPKRRPSGLMGRLFFWRKSDFASA